MARFVSIRAVGVFTTALTLVGAAPLRALAAPPSGSASEEEIAKARELFLRAQGEEERTEYLAALEKFERVLAVKDTSSVRFHLGYCSERLGRLAAAMKYYEVALRESEREGNSEVKRLAAKAIESLQSRVPRVAVRCPANAKCEVRLDGKAISESDLALPLLVDPGRHNLTAKGPHGELFDDEWTLNERDSKTVAIVFAAPKASPSPLGATAGTSKSESDSSSRSTNGWAWAAAGGALALVGLGVGSYVAAGSAQDSLRVTCAAHPSCDDGKTGVRAWDTVALSSFLGAAALATVSIVLFTRPTRANAAARSLVHPLSLSGVF